MKIRNFAALVALLALAVPAHADRAQGRVVLPSGEPVQGTAYAYRLGDGAAWRSVQTSSGPTAPASGAPLTLTGKVVGLVGSGHPMGKGYFDFPDGLPVGTYSLHVHHDGREEWAWPLVVPPGGIAGVAPVRIGGPAIGQPQGGDFPPITPLAAQFTAGTFTASVSYYGAVGAPLDRVKRDLTRFRQAGFGNARIWIDWPDNRAPASSCMKSNGSFIEDKAAHLDAILDFMASIGMSADLTMRAAAYDFVKTDGEGYEIPGHKAAVKSVLRRWGKHPAVRILDMANEAEALGSSPGSGSPGNGHVSPARFKELMDAARSVPHACLVSASVSGAGEFGDVSRNYLTTNEGHSAGLWRDTKGDIALPHWPRVTGWGAKEGPQAKALAAKLGVPTYNQEPARNAYGGSNWPLSEFEASFRSAKANSAVGQCFHTGAGFNLTQKDAFDQLDATERQVVAGVAEWSR
jgi:hypothetical protein